MFDCCQFPADEEISHADENQSRHLTRVLHPLGGDRVHHILIAALSYTCLKHTKHSLIGLICD